jgi:hypothetical protein
VSLGVAEFLMVKGRSYVNGVRVSKSVPRMIRLAASALMPTRRLWTRSPSFLDWHKLRIVVYS